jgi:hypothetical protein
LHDFSSPRDVQPFTPITEEHYNNGERDGLKGCAFNVLEAFHSAIQMPPCLGHDILEGVVAYDMFSLLKMIIKTHKWFSLEALNQKIKTFPFPTKDKPYPIVLQNKFRLSGSAVQIWVLLRHILLILSSFPVDKNYLSYELIEILVEITAMVTAPKLNMMTQGL